MALDRGAGESDAGGVQEAPKKSRLRYFAYLKGKAKHYPSDFAARWDLARLINAEFGMTIVTPWSVGRLPEDDVEEILYWVDLRGQLFPPEGAPPKGEK